jgi:aldehyde:ferredoxin oxidoreductase
MSIVIRIDRKDLTANFEAVPDEWERLGGRAITSDLINREVDPNCDPLGPGNKLVIAPGLLSGTTAPCSGRISVGAKSPLTGGIKESNAGGTAARAMARLGIKALVIENIPAKKELQILYVCKDGVGFYSAADIADKGTYESMAALRQRFGTKCAILCIGQAGERLMHAASIAINTTEGYPSRHCGRGGMGAVMGSKGLKAIVFDDANVEKEVHNCQPNDPEAYSAFSKAWAKTLIDTKKILTRFGTSFLVDAVNRLGAMPTRNYSTGQFDRVQGISSETLESTVLSRGGRMGHPCMPGCVIRCSNIYHDAEGNYLTSGLEYETIALMGANLDIDDYDFIATMDRMCDDFGVDTMEIGTALGTAMEAGMIPFGDKEKAMDLLRQLGDGTPLGAVLGQGAATFGKNAGCARIPGAKGQALAAYDPRAFKGNGVTYATSPMGGDHTAGNMLAGRGKWRGVEDTLQSEGQIDASIDVQLMTTVLDSLGFCIFTGPVPETMDWIGKILTATFGETILPEDLLSIGRKTLETEVAFNVRAGLGMNTNRISEFFYHEPLAPNNTVFDVDRKRLESKFHF